MLDWSGESFARLRGVMGTPPLWTVWRIVVQILECSVTDFLRLPGPALHLVRANRLRAHYEAIIRDRQCLSIYLATCTIRIFNVGCHDRTTALSFCGAPPNMPSSDGGGFGKDRNPLPLLRRWYALVDVVLSMSVLDVLPPLFFVSFLEPHVLGEGPSRSNGWEFSCSIRGDVPCMQYFTPRDLAPVCLDLVHDLGGSLSNSVSSIIQHKIQVD